jgi:hypothetical protein
MAAINTIDIQYKLHINRKIIDLEEAFQHYPLEEQIALLEAEIESLKKEIFIIERNSMPSNSTLHFYYSKMLKEDITKLQELTSCCPVLK